MIKELEDMINVADANNNQKTKRILLKIAELKEEKWMKIKRDYYFK